MELSVPPLRLAIDVDIAEPAWSNAIDLPDLLEKAAKATLSTQSIHGNVEISVLATSDNAIAELNEGFRGEPKPTNVLSWPSSDLAPLVAGLPPPAPSPDPSGELFLGDIALAYETCAREAEEAEKSLSEHATHLIVHAILHLLGYDHISDDDAALMEKTEVDILRTLGVPDPY